MKADGVFGPDIDHPVHGLQVEILGLVIEGLVDLLAFRLGFVGHLKELGGHRHGVAGPVHQGEGAVLDGQDLIFQPLGCFRMALLTGLKVVFQRAHDVVVGDLVGPYPDIGHMAVGTGDVGLPVDAVPAVELVLRMADVAQLETGDVLLPLQISGVALEDLDDVFYGDVAFLAPLPGEEDVDGLHILVFLDHIGYMALAAYASFSFWWQRPHTSGFFRRCSARCWLPMVPMLWASWQSMQVTPIFWNLTGILLCTSR